MNNTFKSLSIDQLIETLGLTIKKDDTNKLVTFLGLLSAYTENSQFNISFNAPSSTGKSYIGIELSFLFPKEDVIKISYASPTAFYHTGVWNNEKKILEVDLERKILIFLDQPHNQLLQRLRPLLSHDEKEIRSRITDKTEKYGIRTKEVVIRGFPSVTFCTAGLRIDEQEATRMFLLSPEISQEKIKEAIDTKISKEADPESFRKWLNENSERQLLIERIQAIKSENITEIKIGSSRKLADAFYHRNAALKPKHARDIGRICSLIKVLALLNLWFREKDESTIIANDNDIQNALDLWDNISESQEYNLPPYVYDFHKNILVPLFNEKNSESDSVLGKQGLTKQEILQKHYQAYGRYLPDWQFRQEIVPMLETAGLLTQEKDDLIDKRKILYYPTVPLTIHQDTNNSESEGVVNEIDSDKELFLDAVESTLAEGSNANSRRS